CCGRRPARQLCQAVPHRRPAGGLVVRPWRPVRARHAVPAPRAERPAAGGGARPMTVLPAYRLEAAMRRRTWGDLREAAVRRAPPPLTGRILYLEKLTVSFDGFKA